MMRRLCLLAGILYLTPACRAQEADDPRAAFLALYEPHAARLAKRYSRIRYRMESRMPRGKDQEVRTTCHGMFDLDHYLAINEYELFNLDGMKLGDEEPIVNARNPKYSFLLHKKGEGRYVLGNNPFSSTNSQVGPSTLRSGLVFPFAHAGKGMTYLDYMRDPKTTVHNVTKTTWRGHDAYEVHCSSMNYHLGMKKEVRREGIWLFAPDLDWVCIGARSINSNSAEPKVEHIYFYDASQGWPVPKKFETRQNSTDGPPEGTLIQSFDILEFAPATDWDESRFRLSAFGLPEPAGVEWPRPTPRWAWLLAAAAALAVMAMILAWLARRRWRAQAA